MSGELLRRVLRELPPSEFLCYCTASQSAECHKVREEQDVLRERPQETAVLRTDNVAAPSPNRNLVNLAVSISVENWSVFDENWSVLDENSGPAGLPALPAFRPNIILK